MALSLAESVKHYNNPLATGVAMDMIEVSPFFGMIPFQPIDGNSYTHKFQNNWAGAAYVAPNATIPAGAQTDATIDKVTFELTSIIGEATVDNFIQATSRSAGQDAMAFQLSSRARSVARRHQLALVRDLSGDPDGANAINSIESLVAASQILDESDASTGSAVSLDGLRALLDAVLSKGGDVDMVLVGRKGRREILKLADAAGGRTAEYTLFTDPFTGTQRQILRVEGVPFLVNDHIDESASLPFYALNMDDGSREVGFSMLYPSATPAGIVVEAVGVSETKDAQITRVKQYAQSALFNRKGAAIAKFQLPA